MSLRGRPSWTSLSGSGPSVLRRDGDPTSEKSRRVSVFSRGPYSALPVSMCVRQLHEHNISVIHITPPFFFAEKSIHNKRFLEYSKDVETYRGDSLYALKKIVHAIHVNNPSPLPGIYLSSTSGRRYTPFVFLFRGYLRCSGEGVFLPDENEMKTV